MTTWQDVSETEPAEAGDNTVLKAHECKLPGGMLRIERMEGTDLPASDWVWRWTRDGNDAELGRILASPGDPLTAARAQEKALVEFYELTRFFKHFEDTKVAADVEVPSEGKVFSHGQPSELAPELYAAYGESTGNKNYQGHEMPKWGDLPDAVKKAWVASAQRAIDKLTGT